MKTTQQKWPPTHPLQPRNEKVFVKVNTTFDCTGSMMPSSIIWSDGRVFPIDAVTDYRPASMLAPGRNGDCYTVIIKGERKFLFFQRNTMINDHRVGRWWVEVES